jgi:hypothetical protein
VNLNNCIKDYQNQSESLSEDFEIIIFLFLFHRQMNEENDQINLSNLAKKHLNELISKDVCLSLHENIFLYDLCIANN